MRLWEMRIKGKDGFSRAIMGLADLVESVALDQLDDPAETGFDVGRQ
jgi:hypothetical protein